MASYLIEGIEIGIIFGIPVGIIGVLSIQRTIMYGKLVGIVTGLGSSVADLIYACIGALGLTIISDFLLRNQTYINFIGGSIIFIIGIKLIMTREIKYSEETNVTSITKAFLTSFTISITNPTTILSFIFVFSYWGIPSDLYILEAIYLILGIFIGTCIWWCVITMSISFLKEKIKDSSIVKLNKLFGSVIIVLSFIVIGRVMI